LGHSQEIPIVTNQDEKAKTDEYITEINKMFLPSTVMTLKYVDNDEISNLVPYTKGQTMVDNKPTVYICEDYVCQQPITEDILLKDRLEKEKGFAR